MGHARAINIAPFHNQSFSIVTNHNKPTESILPHAIPSSTGSIITIDIGKSLSKVSLWSRQGELLDRQTRPNVPCQQGSLRRLDVTGIGEWLLASLAKYAGQPIEAIIPVGHGAGVVALCGQGEGQTLAFPPLDYEQPIPPDILAAYRKQRDPFTLTGSPALPDGLNIGTQLFWLDQLYPDLMPTATLLPWAQYWAWILAGQAVSEVTSLGCHSDLWSPAVADYSPLAKAQGWAARFAPLAHAGDTAGTLTAQIAAKTGLATSAKVLVGLHDSNAALLATKGFAEVAGQEATILSTGTWFIAMRSPQQATDLAALPEAQDCLVNVDVNGQPVPSARFMGGREIELLGARIDYSGTDGVVDVLHAGAMVLPSHVPGCGPFPTAIGRWLNRPADAQEQAAAVALYAALMADAALDLIGSTGTLVIEGRFAACEILTRALASLRPATQVFTASGEVDVSFGALRLHLPDLAPPGILTRVLPLDPRLAAYREEWLDDIEDLL